MGRIRFNFNLSTGTSSTSSTTRRLNGRNFATAIIRDVGLAYADKRFNELKSEVSSGLKQDVEREIESVARQYRTLIVGAVDGTGKQRTRQGVLRTNTATGVTASGRIKYADSVSLNGLLPSWAPLSKKYISWKMKEVGHAKFFEAKEKWLRTYMAKGSTWEAAFGGVSVRIVRTGAASDFSNLPANSLSDTSLDRKVVFSLAKIEVRALGEITAEMLPNLVTNKLGFSGLDGRKSGLLNLVGRHDVDLAYRLGGRRSTPYRPTLEPFLAFLLTRAIPAAVKNRISIRAGLVSEEVTSGVKRTR